MDLKVELDSTVAMKLDKDNLAKILSLWLHVEALTPFDRSYRTDAGELESAPVLSFYMG